MDMDMDMDEDEKHAHDVMEATTSVLSELDKLMQEILAHGEDASTDERESSICTAIYRLSNLASPETRMGSFLPSAEQFMEDDEDELSTHRILREACFMAACRGHPSLVNLSAVDRDPDTGKYCLVMEHVGPSLDDLLYHQRGCKIFTERQVRRIMRQVLSGAMVMHQRRIVHRAINSGNIFVAGDGSVVKIGDYRDAASMFEWHGDFAGVLLSHQAPEYLVHQEGRNSMKDLDLWSMGCLMLELLTGQDQFHVESGGEGDTLQKIEDVLGFSDKGIMESVDKPATVDTELSPEVQRYRVQWRGKSRLRELVPPRVLSEEGFRVLQGLLMYCPKARITAEHALKLPWFTRNTDDSAAPPVSVSYTVGIGGDSAPAVSVSGWVCILALAVLFLTVFAFLIRR